MEPNQKIRINKFGSGVINSLNSGTKHDQYSGRVICEGLSSSYWLIEIDQPGVNTFKTVWRSAEFSHITDKAFIYLPRSFFELI